MNGRRGSIDGCCLTSVARCSMQSGSIPITMGCLARFRGSRCRQMESYSYWMWNGRFVSRMRGMLCGTLIRRRSEQPSSGIRTGPLAPCERHLSLAASRRDLLIPCLWIWQQQRSSVFGIVFVVMPKEMLQLRCLASSHGASVRNSENRLVWKARRRFYTASRTLLL